MVTLLMIPVTSHDSGDVAIHYSFAYGDAAHDYGDAAHDSGDTPHDYGDHAPDYGDAANDSGDALLVTLLMILVPDSGDTAHAHDSGDAAQ